MMQLSHHRHETARRILASLSLIIIIVVIVLSYSPDEMRRWIVKHTPTAPTTQTPRPQRASSGELIERTTLRRCDKGQARKIIAQLTAAEIIYKIDDAGDYYPRVYVTQHWRNLPMDQKRQVDLVLGCFGSDGGRKDIIVKYYDHRTEEKIALGGRGGLDLK
jgi:hypothetical protein